MKKMLMALGVAGTVLLAGCAGTTGGPGATAPADTTVHSGFLPDYAKLGPVEGKEGILRYLDRSVDLRPYTKLYLDPVQPLLLVSFGRSGNSPESLATVALVESIVRDVRHLVVTCNPEGALGRAPARQLLTLQLPEETHDASFAMTSSFSCMMYATLAAFVGTAPLQDRVRAIAQSTRQVINGANGSTQQWALAGYDRVVYLGSGLLQGLAREAALKLGELTNGAVATCFDSPLGFRHGPKTFLTPRTLVMVFVANDPLTRGLARDLGPDRIRVNEVVPGWVYTERQIALWVTPEAEARSQAQQCLKGRLQPDDIARMVLWLAADDSAMVTAQAFAVDGGGS